MKVEELLLKVMNGQRLCASSNHFGLNPCTKCPYVPEKSDTLQSGACMAELAKDTAKLKNIAKAIDKMLEEANK